MSDALAPCVAIVGPANSGKTTLLHLLDRALQRHPSGLLAYVLKGNPDHTGRYLFQNPALRDELKSEVKGRWAGAPTIDQIVAWTRNCRSHLDLALLDFGGRHDPNNDRMLRECTHYMALARRFDDPAQDEKDGLESWCAEADAAGLRPLAKLRSEKTPLEVWADATGPVLTGVFRGDAASPADTVNDPVVEALTNALMALPMPGRRTSYVNLNIGRWNAEDPAADLQPMLERIRFVARSASPLQLGGVAPNFAYLLAMHAALDANPNTEIQVADPKYEQFLVDIPARCLSAPGTLSPYFAPEPGLAEGRRWKFHSLTEDKFFPFEVPDKLAYQPTVPGAVAGAGEVIVWGVKPIWLNCAYSRWLRAAGVATVGVWDATTGREIVVYSRATPAVAGK